ncbi:hypothetical protein [Aureispira anguillae]|uniref:Uncharacterized protein n=1 Tax=Aureispira anguillae TaxID=2864201 RepID=A0A915YKI8_9BACT|nr:hypothetical protein [Aureispira anguillae]BDS14783.1 hypothetical protein AsAng_0055650 [Aureispira anguillae]
MNEDLYTDEIKQLEAFSSPLKLIKKALSSFFIVLMIGAGFVINWIMAVVFLVGYFSATSWLWFILGLLLMILIFPALYLFFAYSYGQSVLFWEAYKEGIRPIAAKVFSRTLDSFLVDNPEEASEVNESKIVKEVEERKKHFLEQLPDFIRAYFQIFFTSGDIIKIVKAQRQSGAEKEAVKQKAMHSFFESLDLQMSELMEPSLIPFYIVAAVNLITLYFLF